MLTIEIAGVPFEVRCRFEERNREFFKDYLTEKRPFFSIEPSEDDMDKVREAFDRVSIACKTKKTQYPATVVSAADNQKHRENNS